MLPQENAVKVFLELMRPLNCLMAGVAAIIGMLIAGGREIEPAALIFLAVFLVTGAGNAVNDYFDREIDAINRPGRPVPSGRVTPRSTLLWSLALFIIGCILAGLVNLLCLAIAAANSVLLYIYARNLKATPLAGNLCVAYLTGSTFLFGGAVFGWPGLQANLVPFSLSSLATMSREVAKDIEDIEGDREGGAKTLPIILGEKFSSFLAALFGAAVVALSFVTSLGIAYRAIVSVADIFFLFSMRRVLKGDPTGARKALKKGMAVAIVAFLAGTLCR
jgi:geranylgeranylglycerol-phosphate geranylgeranyltransferase